MMAAAPMQGDRQDAVPAHLRLLHEAEHAAERLFTVHEGCRMVWRRWGSGPPLVLLHGGHGSWRHWIRTIPALAPRRTLLVADLPGLGDSDDVPQPVTPERIAQHVRHGVCELVADAPVDVVGFSFGSSIAGHTAALMGDRIGTLVLTGPGALGLTIRKIDLLQWDSTMPTDQLREVLRTNLSRLMLDDPGRIDELAIQIQYENTRRARVKSRTFAASDTLARALRRASPQRLFAIWGEQDAIARGHFDERKAFFRSLRQDVGIHLVPGAGHWVAYEAAETFNRLLQDCLQPG